MDAQSKMIGAAGCQLVAASGVTAVKTGYQAWGCMVRVDNTQILSVNKIETDTAASGVVTDESWENVNLLANIDFISFEDPITSITLVSGTPSVMLFLDHKAQ
jgi:hypothetical protein